jgi:hypothetical protein
MTLLMDNNLMLKALKGIDIVDVVDIDIDIDIVDVDVRC